MKSVHALLRESNLRDTQSRRLIVEALSALGKPASHKDIVAWIEKKGASVNLVTVYRVLETFESLGIVHRHPSTGGFLLCSMDEEGHHGFLSCQKCGTVKEFTNEKLCTEENRIAKNAGFTPKHHLSEIIGLCGECA